MQKQSLKSKFTVAGISPQKLMAQGLSKATAYRAVKRGYYIPNYHKRTVVVGDLSSFNVENAYRIARAVFYRHFYYRVEPFWTDDFIQKGILRMLELSGISQDGNFQYKVALNAMRSYSQKNRLLRRQEIYKEKEDNYENSNNEIQKDTNFFHIG